MTTSLPHRAAALLAAVTLLMLGAFTPGAHATPVVGIADQHGETFSTPAFTALGVKTARLNLAWDALDSDWQLAELDQYMASAQAAGVDPLIIFSQSRLPGRTRILPSADQYGQMIDRLRQRYPQAHLFAAWNEANHPGQPTYKKPVMVARYYQQITSRCPSCTVMPASLLDNKKLVPWTKKLARLIRRQGAPRPKVWGLHNYSDVNRLKSTSTKALLKAVKGKVWLTETGGVVHATSPTASTFPQGDAYAGKVTSFILNKLARNPRIERIYLYQWQAPAGTSWDSGLLSPDGQQRPAYQVLAGWLASHPQGA